MSADSSPETSCCAFNVDRRFDRLAIFRLKQSQNGGAPDHEKNREPDGLCSVFLASIHAYRNEKDVAFEWLEKAFQEHASFLTYLKILRYFDNLHGDPRFDALVRRIGIPD